MENSAVEQKVSEQLDRNANGGFMTVRKALAHFQKYFDNEVTVPLSCAQNNAQLETASQNQPEESRASFLEKQLKEENVQLHPENELHDENINSEESTQTCDQLKIEDMQREMDALKLQHEETVKQLTSQIRQLKIEKKETKLHFEKERQAWREERQTSMTQEDEEMCDITREYEEMMNRIQEKALEEDGPQQTDEMVWPEPASAQRPVRQQNQSDTSSTIKALQDEIQQLKEKLQTQEQQAANASRQGPIKKERQRYEDLQRDFNKKVEECKDLERKNNILTCNIQDLKRELTVKAKGSVKERTFDRICTCEEHVREINQLKTALKQLQEELKREEEEKLEYRNHLNGIVAEDKKLRIDNGKLKARLNLCTSENNVLKAQVQSLDEMCRESNELQDQLQNEKNKTASLETRSDLWKERVKKEKEALESSVAKLTLELSQERQEKEKEQRRVKELEREMKNQREIFTATIRKYLAEFNQKGAAKGD